MCRFNLEKILSEQEQPQVWTKQMGTQNRRDAQAFMYTLPVFLSVLSSSDPSHSGTVCWESVGLLHRWHWYRFFYNSLHQREVKARYLIRLWVCLFFLFFNPPLWRGAAKGSTTVDKGDCQLASTSAPDKFSLALKPEITCLPTTTRLEHEYLY